MILQHTRRRDRLAQIPAAGRPVRGGDAHQQRHVLRDRGTDRVHDLHQEPHAPVQVAAVLIGTLVDQRIEELRDQIPVRGVDLDGLEPGGHRAPGGCGELAHNRMDLIHAQFARRGIGAIGVGAGRHGLPPALLNRHARTVMADAEAARGALAPGVVELHGHGRARILDALHDPTPGLDLRILP